MVFEKSKSIATNKGANGFQYVQIKKNCDVPTYLDR